MRSSWSLLCPEAIRWAVSAENIISSEQIVNRERAAVAKKSGLDSQWVHVRGWLMFTTGGMTANCGNSPPAILLAAE